MQGSWKTLIVGAKDALQSKDKRYSERGKSLVVRIFNVDIELFS